MSNIIKFPRLAKPPPGDPAPAPAAPPPPPLPDRPSRGLVAASIHCAWVVMVLLWPVLKWVAAIEVFFQFLRMFYHWETPGVNAGWTFLLHFTVLTGLTYFVSIYKPKGV